LVVFIKQKINDGAEIQDINRENYDLYSIDTYHSKEALEGIQNIHRGILKGATVQFYENINIIYFMKDGSEIRRYFTLRGHDGDSNSFLFEQGIQEWVSSQEYKENKMPFVFKDAYAKDYEDAFMAININEERYNFILDSEILKTLRSKLLIDINESIKTLNYDDLWTIFSTNDNTLLRSEKYESQSDVIWINISNNKGEEVTFDVLDQYHNTRAFIQGLIENK
jgi:hypothetical protein